MSWHLVYTKPRSEQCALDNLLRQGYECYLPMMTLEKVRRGLVKVVQEPLFPRYLFIRLDKGLMARSWAPVRSTTGVSNMVVFGLEAATVDDAIVEAIQTQEQARQHAVQPAFDTGERLLICNGPFAGVEGLFQMSDGDSRVIVLIQMLNKPVKISLPPAHVQTVA